MTALKLPAPERYKDWRVLTEDEKKGKATGRERHFYYGADCSLCCVIIYDTELLDDYKDQIVIVPPDYGKRHFDDCREIDCEYDKLDKDIQKRLCALDYTDVEFRHAYTSRWISCLETGHFAQGDPSGEIIYRQKRKEEQQEPERNEDEQETAKQAMPITHIACRVEGSSSDVMMSLVEVKRQMEGVE